MKEWVRKLINQLDYDFAANGEKSKGRIKLSEDRATLLYLIDIYNKHLIDIDSHPVRRVRETLDEFAKELVSSAQADEADKVLFKFRQFFSAYRVAEYAYIRKNFEDFKSIIWNFVEQMSDDIHAEQSDDKEVQLSLRELKEAVEADSIDLLRSRSREFIDCYIEKQSKKETRRNKRMKGIKKDLQLVRKQLADADQSARTDHLSGAFNRRSFDEHCKELATLGRASGSPSTLLVLDIDHFKKVNDTYGHDVGDFVIKECVRFVKEVFDKDADFVARIGGEEFAVLLPDHAVAQAVKRADECMARIRKEVFIQQGSELRFTVSMGIAQLLEGENADQWLKRADAALYQSKHSGRNRYTVAAPHSAEITRVA